VLQRILLSAVGAGLAVGLVVAAIQQFTTAPLILRAEIFEGGGAAYHHDADADAAPHEHDAQAWSPAAGAERIAYTSLATVVTAIGFALMLIAAMVLKGGPIDGRAGLLWGLGGFAAVALAPALGLPPELPGSAAADLAERQLWWVATAVATAAGLGLMAFAGGWALRAAGLALIALPHLIGAPQPNAFTSTAPAELSGEFVAASIALAAVFWALLGWAGGTLYGRLEQGRAAG